MTFYFITGNKNKFEEYKAVLGDVVQLEVDLPEIQDVDPHNIVREKLLHALEHRKEDILVEDVSLELDCLNGLPGPFIKWFLLRIGPGGLAEIAQKIGNTRACSRAIIGYARSPSDMHFFEGTLYGDIVPARGVRRFGWDVIFQPEGYGKTYAELGMEEKNKVSMRRKALDKLKSFLDV